MKFRPKYLLDKIKGIGPTSLALGTLFLFTLLIVPLVLYAILGQVVLNEKSYYLASIIGGIVGPILSFLTLAFILLNNYSDSQDKSFRQTLDFIEKLIASYNKALTEYEANDDEYPIVITYPEPYLKHTQPLFSITMLAMRTNRCSFLQHEGLRSILLSQLKPMVEQMRYYEERIERIANESRPDNEIAKRQLAQLDNL